MQVFLTYISAITLLYNVVTGIITILFYRHYLVFKTQFGKSLVQIMILISIHSLYLLIHSYVFENNNSEYTIPFSLLYGPLMYMALQKERFLKNQNLYRVLNFTPFIFVLLYLILCFIYPEIELFSERNFTRVNYGITSFVFLNYGIQLVRLFIASVRLNNVEENPIEFTFVIAIILISASLVYLGFLFFDPGKDMVHSFFLLHIIMTLCLILISFKLTKIQKYLLTRLNVVSSGDVDRDGHEKNTKYAKSRLDDEQLLLYKKAIESLENSFFYNPDLNLEMLEEHLKIKKYYLTQAFSLTLDTSFTNYTNCKRVEYAKQIMQGNVEIKSTELAFMVGFSSVQNFNKVFQSLEGVTPTKYRNYIKKSISKAL